MVSLLGLGEASIILTVGAAIREGAGVTTSGTSGTGVNTGVVTEGAGVVTAELSELVTDASKGTSSSMPHDLDRLCPFFFFFLPFPKLGSLLKSDDLGDVVARLRGSVTGSVVLVLLSLCCSPGASPQDLVRRWVFLGIEDSGAGSSKLGI